jgi:hypothetical protein
VSLSEQIVVYLEPDGRSGPLVHIRVTHSRGDRGGEPGYGGSRDFYCCGFGFGGGFLGLADFFRCWSCF